MKTLSLFLALAGMIIFLFFETSSSKMIALTFGIVSLYLYRKVKKDENFINY